MFNWDYSLHYLYQFRYTQDQFIVKTALNVLDVWNDWLKSVFFIINTWKKKKKETEVAAPPLIPESTENRMKTEY